MKKLKIILFILTIFLCAVFLFATCKKTKALDYVGIDDTYTVSRQGQNAIAYVVNLDSESTNILWLLAGNTSYVVDFFTAQGNRQFRLYDVTNQRVVTTLINTTDLSNIIQLQLCYDYVEDDLYLGLATIDVNLAINNNVVSVSSITRNEDYIALYNIPHTEDLYNYYYNSTLSLKLKFQNYSYIKGPLVIVEYNPASDYSQEADEQFEFMFDYQLKDYINTKTIVYNAQIVYNQAYSIGYTAGYNTGYNLGYQLGYDEGYTAGQTAGYNSGYQAGYNAGVNDNQEAFDRGYSDGYADGYSYGTVHGYDDGYATGYNVGFEEGQAGATPVSKTIGVVSSIFAGIGSVLAVELFPGFSLGILILVPLFFGVLGLILWIWRRN